MIIKYKICQYPEIPANFNPDEDDEDASYDELFDTYEKAENQLKLLMEVIENPLLLSRHRRIQTFQIKKLYIANLK
jgi:hypothetical protein